MDENSGNKFFCNFPNFYNTFAFKLTLVYAPGPGLQRKIGLFSLVSFFKSPPHRITVNNHQRALG
jgi:hypothetical protein